MRLTINKISKSYGANKALSEFYAELTPGIYALLGPNGSGKSTLMNIMTDNLKADSGEMIYTCGDVSENTLKMGVRFREKLGFMPQYPGMYPNFTAEQFLRYMATLKDMGRGLKGKEKKDYISNEITSALSSVELDDVRDRRIGAFSGGMKQRLALASAVLGDPEILILDEPTAGLDPKQRIAIRNYISRIALNKIVIIATHVVADVEYIAKSVIMLKKGIIIDNAPPSALMEKMKGKVWTLSVPENMIGELQRRFRVTNIVGDERIIGNATLRVISDKKPDEFAINTTPNLEDYYLYIFGNEI